MEDYNRRNYNLRRIILNMIKCKYAVHHHHASGDVSLKAVKTSLPNFNFNCFQHQFLIENIRQ